MFRKLGLGPLIGKRTWGGLVGILGTPPLLDGGFVTAPNLAFWNEDGFASRTRASRPTSKWSRRPRTSSRATIRSSRRPSRWRSSSSRNTRRRQRSARPTRCACAVRDGWTADPWHPRRWVGRHRVSLAVGQTRSSCLTFDPSVQPRTRRAVKPVKETVVIAPFEIPPMAIEKFASVGRERDGRRENRL